MAVGRLRVAFAASLGLLAARGAPTFAAPAPVDYFKAPFETERVLSWGDRPDWSADGSRLVFTDAQNDGERGYAFELDLKTRKLRCLTCHLGPDLGKVVRIYHLPDESFLVTQGPDPQSRSPLNTGMFWLPAAADRPPLYLGAGAMGDIAVSGRRAADGSVAVAWGAKQDSGDWTLTTARLTVAGGAARLGQRRVVYTYAASRPGTVTFAEAYDFTDDDASLVFFTVERPTPNGEMYKIDLRSGRLTNLSRSPQHNEAHLFPDGRFALEESNRASDPDGPLRGISGFPPAIIPWFLGAAGVPVPASGIDPKARARPFDLYAVAYDGSGRLRRLTDIGAMGGEAHQSAPAPDGRRIAFCLDERASAALRGRGGLYVGSFR